MPGRTVRGSPEPAVPTLLLAGRADVFAVRCDAEGQAGARHHLFRLQGPALLPATGLQAGGLGLLAVPLPDARCVRADDAAVDDALHAQAAERLAQALATWLGPDTPCTGHAPTAPDAPATPATLATLQSAVLARAAEQLQAEALAQAGRLQHKAAATRAAMAGALLGLTRLGQGDDSAVAPADDDALLQACQLLGRHAGLSFTAPARRPDGPPLDRLEAIAQASRVRCRRVLLRGRWWTQDNGPLLALLPTGPGDADLRPVALLPGRGGRAGHYRLIDPASGRAQRLAEETAARIEPQAMCFYRPLPAKRLGLAGLLRFGASGLRPDLLRVLLAGLAVGLLGLATPLVAGWLVDEAVPSADKAGVLALAAALLAATVAAVLLEAAQAVALLRIEGRMDASLQAAVWDRVLSLPAGFFRRHAAGDLAQRIHAIDDLREGLSGAALDTLLASLFALSNLALMFWLSPELAWLALGVIVLGRGVSLVAGLLRLRVERQRAALAGEISALVHELLGAIVKLRLCAAEARAFANWAAQYTRLRALMARSMRVVVAEQTFLGGYPVLASAAVFAAAGTLVFANDGGATAALTTGGFIAFNAAFGTAFSASMALSTALLDLMDLVPDCERLRPLLDATPETTAAQAAPGALRGEIEVQNLGHAYPDGPPVLHGVSFRIQPGEFVAIVGPSGSGKSTLMRLLMGFEQPQTGSVCYDGHNLQDLDANALRRQLGVVLQSGQLTTGDIFSNIAGISGATPDQVRQAVRLCGLEADIDALPMGLHTVIGEGSSTLSGGQRQRILIARAIVARPSVLLLDEATSALDNRSQQLVADSLARLGGTRVVIAHRLSTIVRADRILVLDQGRLVQSGRHDELMRQSGLFAELARRQGD